MCIYISIVYIKSLGKLSTSSRQSSIRKIRRFVTEIEETKSIDLLNLTPETDVEARKFAWVISYTPVNGRLNSGKLTYCKLDSGKLFNIWKHPTKCWGFVASNLNKPSYFPIGKGDNPFTIFTKRHSWIWASIFLLCVITMGFIPCWELTYPFQGACGIWTPSLEGRYNAIPRYLPTQTKSRIIHGFGSNSGRVYPRWMILLELYLYLRPNGQVLINQIVFEEPLISENKKDMTWSFWWSPFTRNVVPWSLFGGDDIIYPVLWQLSKQLFNWGLIPMHQTSYINDVKWNVTKVDFVSSVHFDWRGDVFVRCIASQIKN